MPLPNRRPGLRLVAAAAIAALALPALAQPAPRAKPPFPRVELLQARSEGARAIDSSLMQVAHAYRLTRWPTFSRVYLPQLYPYLMAAARTGLSLIWKIVLVVELLGRSNGIGFQLNVFFQLFDIAGILAYTLVFASIVLLVEALFMRPLERRLTGWRH